MGIGAFAGTNRIGQRICRPGGYSVEKEPSTPRCAKSNDSLVNCLTRLDSAAAGGRISAILDSFEPLRDGAIELGSVLHPRTDK